MLINELRAEVLKSDAVLIDHLEWVLGQGWLDHLHCVARVGLEELWEKKGAALRSRIPQRILSEAD